MDELTIKSTDEQVQEMVTTQLDQGLKAALGITKETLIKRVESQMVTSYPTEAEMNTAISNLNKVAKLADAARLKTTEPYRGMVDKINAAAKAWLEPLKVAKKIGDDRLRDFTAKKLAEEAEARRKAEVEQTRRKNISESQGGTGENIQPVEAPTPKHEVRSQTKFVTRHNLTVTDVHALVHAKFQYLDDETVKEALRVLAQKDFNAEKKRVGRLFKIEMWEVPGTEIAAEKIPTY